MKLCGEALCWSQDTFNIYIYICYVAVTHSDVAAHNSVHGLVFTCRLFKQMRLYILKNVVTLHEAKFPAAF